MTAVVAICLGACAGALLRWQVSEWLNPGGLLPWGTLAVNLAGGYLVGLGIGTFEALPNIDPAWRLALITGFLGALTTFSAFSAEVVTMLQSQRYAVAFATASLHLFGSLLLTIAGLATAHFFIARS